MLSGEFEPDFQGTFTWETVPPGVSCEPSQRDAGQRPTPPARCHPKSPVGPQEEVGALATLVHRIMRQDQKAMEELYTSQSDRVYRVALRITRQGAAAEEVLQDTFWQVWRQAPRFDPLRGSVSAWLLAIARSRAIDMVRASVRDPVQCCASPLDPEDTAHASLAADPVERLHDTRRSDHLHLTLAALSPLRRQLLSLAYFQGLTHSEIACHMDLPLGTVKTHCRRALAAMRLVLDRQSGAPQRPCV